MAKKKESLGGEISKSVKGTFSLDRFKNTKGLNASNSSFKAQEWIPLSPAWQEMVSLPGIPHGHITLLRGHSDTGKAQPHYSKIYTPNGFKTMGEIEVGDLVMGKGGKPIKVLAIYPQGEKETYRITFSDGFHVDCCGEHLWNVKTIANRLNEYWNIKDKRNPNLIEDYEKWETLTTEELIEGLYIYNKDGTKVPNYKMPICDPVNFTKKPLNIPPYTLGCLIGDGSFCDPRSTVNLTNIDDYILDKVKQEIETHFDGYTLKQVSDTISYNIVRKKGEGQYKNPIIEELKDLKLYGHKSQTKFIPKYYLYSSVEDRIELLNGLMDTDGTLDANGTHIYYSTTSKQLAYDVAELGQSLGCVCKVSFRENDFSGCWKVIINQPNTFSIFSLPRKQNIVVEKTSYKTLRSIYSIKSIGKTEQKCIKVDSEDQLYLTDNFTVTHNTTALLEAAVNAQKMGILPVFIVTEMKWSWEHAKMMGLKFEEGVDDEGNKIIDGNFLFADREVLGTVEAVAGFMIDLMNEQKRGNLPMDMVFLWDSIGSVPCQMSVEKEKNNNEWNAGAMSTQFGNYVNQEILLSRKESRPYTNSLIAINKIWVEKPIGPMQPPTMKNKGGNTMFFDASIIVTFGNISNSGTLKVNAVKDGKKVEWAKKVKVSVEKNHINGVTSTGKIVVTPHGFISETKKDMDNYKKAHQDEWCDILGSGPFEVVTEGSEDEDFSNILSTNE